MISQFYKKGVFFIKLSVLWSIVISTSPLARGQWGSTYTFHFTLNDEEGGLATSDQYESLKSKQKKDRLIIETKHARYEVMADHPIATSFADGIISVRYPTISVLGHVRFDVVRKLNDGIDTFHVDFDHLERVDFARLRWEKGKLECDFSFGRDLRYYKYSINRTNSHGRDLTCLVYRTCMPEWERTELGKQLWEEQRKARYDHRVEKMHMMFDSLITTRFDQRMFDRLFELECESGLYNRYREPTCELFYDTTIYTLNRTYKFKDSTRDQSFRLVMVSSLQQRLAYIDGQYGVTGKFSQSDFDFISRDEIIQIARKKYPDFEFEKDVNGEPLVRMVYLSEAPKSEINDWRYPDELKKIGQTTPVETWQGRYVYLLSSVPKQGADYMVCNRRLYFEVTRPNFIRETTYCYNLLD